MNAAVLLRNKEIGGTCSQRMTAFAASVARACLFSDVLADSGAPRGSIYHHFPNGKEQLVADAIAWTSDRVLAYQRANAVASAAEVLETFIRLWRQVVT